MNQTLVQDVVAEVMRRLEVRPGMSARVGEDAPANESKRQEARQAPHSTQHADGRFGIFAKVDDAVSAASESQKKLMKLTLDER
ncbi:MAG TPA: hypothetical protein VG722_13255, partial [Tepidisphaeraceae bacterium]|nr:hypothetical protein [Tepidisphaeraceae bacterium]